MALGRMLFAATALVVVVVQVPTAEALDGQRLAEELLEKPVVAASRGISGIASYYAARFHGRRTNSGEIHDPDLLTAAHPTLPLGTKVLVRNLSNDKEVVVRVNDRCRKRRVPFIDLSREAARRLGFFGRGTTNVKMFLLGRTQ